MSLRKQGLLLAIAGLFGLPLLLTGRLSLPDATAQALSGGGPAASAPSNVRGTRHNLSASAPSRQTTSGNAVTTEPVVQAAAGDANDQICVYCHTPHGASTSPGAPLWNRTLSSATYTGYSSSSLQATDLDVNSATAAPSKLCLSCHDGTIALGNISNAPGSGLGSAVNLQNTGPSGTMPYGRGLANAAHGFTRRLGTDLRNDHPIAFTYNTALATADGELRDPATSTSPTIIANRTPGGVKPHFPLTDDRVQCSTCHDPHKESQKFLRKNRLQTSPPQAAQGSFSDWSFSDSDDQICMACHTRLGKAWAQSAHANSTVANETYTSGDAAVRDFPTNTAVWQAGCLNCHDTHTVGGSRRLLREGVNTGFTTVSQGYTAQVRTGVDSPAAYDTTSALENTCYQCHGNTAVITPTALSASEGVPNIEAEFSRARHMPITNAEQGLSGGNASEVHDILDKDFSETQTKLGKNALSNRHVECTDCHNPHRVIKGNLFTGQSTAYIAFNASRRTHTLGTPHGNVASGALRGAMGVEVDVMGTINGVWPQNPVSWRVVKGDPGASASVERTNTYVTREYQICFKCHSNYSLSDDTTDAYPNNPLLGTSTGKTPSGTNGVQRYTNVAAEFLSVKATDPPTSGGDQGEETNAGTACGGDCNPAQYGDTTLSGPGSTNNHRSWHPVVWPTGRDRAERGSASWNNLRPPYNLSDVGKLTMYCSDCHGSEVSWTQGTSLADTNNGPNLNQVQGPHGSANNFLLKGVWNDTITPSNVAGSNTSGSICGRCHDPRNAVSGFSGASEASHGWEVKASRYCMFCHVALPHGWKNKAFLVNLNCVQSEASGYTGTCTSVGGTGGTGEYTLPPYYYRARLRIASWARSGGWAASNCNGSDWMSSACGI